MHNKLQIIYRHGQPYGIRDENGYLFFFREVSKFSGQEERYRQEVQESLALADYILEALKARANNSVQATGGESAEQTRIENELSEWGNPSRPSTRA